MSSEREQIELLLTAYLDGELSPEEQAKARVLLEDPANENLLNQWSENSNRLKELPRYQLGDGFTDRLVQQVTAQQATSVGPQRETSSQRFGLAAIAALATMIFFAAFVVPKWHSTAPQDPVAVNDSNSRQRSDNEDTTRPEMGMLYASRGGRKSTASVPPSHLNFEEWESRIPVTYVIRLKVAGSLDELRSALSKNGIDVSSQETDGSENKLLHLTASWKQVQSSLVEMFDELIIDSAEQVRLAPLGESSRLTSLAFESAESGAELKEIGQVNEWFDLNDQAQTESRAGWLIIVD